MGGVPGPPRGNERGPLAVGWEPLGNSSGVSREDFGRSGRQFGRKSFRILLKSLLAGCIFGLSCAVVGASWAVLGPSWAVLGLAWGPPRGPRAVFAPPSPPKGGMLDDVDQKMESVSPPHSLHLPSFFFRGRRGAGGGVSGRGAAAAAAQQREIPRPQFAGSFLQGSRTTHNGSVNDSLHAP